MQTPTMQTPTMEMPTKDPSTKDNVDASAATSTETPMETSNHLQIYNPRHDAQQPSSPSSFPLFNQLPPELRRIIWSLCLSVERFLRVQLEAAEDDAEPWHGYTLRVNGRRILSKLMHVNAEARLIAQQAYPVKLPCLYEDGTEGTFYFNPELDILWLNRERDSHKRTVPFFQDLVARDPLGVGLRHLALGSNDINVLADLELSRLSDAGRDTLHKVLSNLEDIYYLSFENAGRVHLGRFSGASIPPCKEFENRRAKPIMACVPSFTRLPGPDPRDGIDRDLSRTFVGTSDPRKMIFRWQKLRRRWQVPVVKGRTKHHFLVSHGRSYRERVLDRDSARQWLRDEHEGWLRGQHRMQKLIEGQGWTVPIESDEELRDTTRTAVGFWLFPLSALGPFPRPDMDEDEAKRQFRPKRVLDMREHRPQLCLANIP